VAEVLLISIGVFLALAYFDRALGASVPSQ
jgi:hypothetical protein